MTKPNENPYSPGEYCMCLLKASNMIDYPEQSQSFLGKRALIREFFCPMASFWELTPIEVEDLVELLSDVIKEEDLIGRVDNNWAYLIVCLMVLKVKNPALYSQVIRGEFSCPNLINDMIEMFCDKDSADFQFQYRFWPCQDIVEEEIYRLASENEWKGMIRQMEAILRSENPHPGPTLAKCTMQFGEARVKRLYPMYVGDESVERHLPRVSLEDIISRIELNAK